MCMLSAYPPGVQPNPEHLANGARINRDGYGYAIVAGDQRKGRRLLIAKSMKWEQLLAQFIAERARHADGPAIFHSRFSTGGRKDIANCHPFRVGRDRQTIVAHNGVLFRVPYTEDRSDTRIWAEDKFPALYRRLDRKRWDEVLQKERYSVLDAIVKEVGTYNKIAILTANPRYEESLYMINFSQGQWLGDQYASGWHSNRDYLGAARWHTTRSYAVPATPATVVSPVGTRYQRTAGLGYGSGGYDGWESPVTGNTYAYRQPDDDSCVLCGAKGALDEYTNVCGYCDTCNDCQETADYCVCYMPARAVPGPRVIGTPNGADGRPLTPDELADIDAAFLASLDR